MYDSIKKLLFSFAFIILSTVVCGQDVTAKLAKAFASFEADAQMRAGIASLYVMDAKSGKVLFQKNASIGLAPASTQKVITSVTAYELLGKDFRFRTRVGYIPATDTSGLPGSIWIQGSGDPTLGSWRWKETGEEVVASRITQAIRTIGIQTYSGMDIDPSSWSSETVPDGWIWQDVGNYYGAFSGPLNWRENQYDLFLGSGKEKGSAVQVVGTIPKLYGYRFTSEATAAAKGTGDNAYIYLPVGSEVINVRGTIPVEEARFTISGAMPSGKQQFLQTLADSLSRYGISKGTINRSPQPDWNALKIIHTETSPPLDSIIFWFNRRSINLYGESLIKALARVKGKNGETGNGIAELKQFWKAKGIHEAELNIVDGSGLSPLNRVTTKAQVTTLYYARKQSWFPGFYLALPEFNGMKMKSGTIRGAKGFVGYHTSSGGREYIFAFLVNNYDGSSSSLVQKMYTVLNLLK